MIEFLGYTSHKWRWNARNSPSFIKPKGPIPCTQYFLICFAVRISSVWSTRTVIPTTRWFSSDFCILNRQTAILIFPISTIHDDLTLHTPSGLLTIRVPVTNKRTPAHAEKPKGRSPQWRSWRTVVWGLTGLLRHFSGQYYASDRSFVLSVRHGYFSSGT